MCCKQFLGLPTPSNLIINKAKKPSFHFKLFKNKYILGKRVFLVPLTPDSSLAWLWPNRTAVCTVSRQQRSNQRRLRCEGEIRSQLSVLIGRLTGTALFVSMAVFFFFSCGGICDPNGLWKSFKLLSVQEATEAWQKLPVSSLAVVIASSLQTNENHMMFDKPKFW